MEGSGTGSPQSSLCMVKPAELFPKPALLKDDEKLTVPFTELAGEGVHYLGQTDDGILALSNYRLFLQKNSTGAEVSVPLGLIESTQVRDLFHLIVNCKDASTVKCSFATSEQCSEWHRRITLAIGVPETLESLFAFPFQVWASDSAALNQDNEWAGRLQRVGSFDDEFRQEAERLQFDLQGAWRISQANADFKLCPSYPRLLLVPACISDDTLQNVASFRSSRRIPAVVWRHQRTGAVIARCSQPEVGWLGWRNSKDEQLLKALSDACSFDKGSQDRSQQQERSRRTSQRTRNSSEASSESSPPRSPEGSHEEVEMDEPKKILIVDARSYTSAVTNRARGGGCECAEYYPSAEIQFMSLGNIHVIRKSFHALRQLCASQADIPGWLGMLERTVWLQHLSGLLAASMVVCHAIERNGRPVLVHCSDGWDRTPQIVATAQLCLDPYYRTIDGFRVLVEREWLSFGHKFADRCGHGPGSDEANERCPVFLQWLDCVHQIHQQFPCSFEFDMGYLIKLAQHSHSCLFGTFLCNTVKERQENSVPDRTFSVWPFLSGPIYKNHLYVPNRERVLWPAHNVRDLRLWSEVYLGSWGGNQQCASDAAEYPPANPVGHTTDTTAVGPAAGRRGVEGSIITVGEPSVVAVGSNGGVAAAGGQDLNGSMTKTRSYSDIKEATSGGAMARRSSDPNMTVDSSILGGPVLHLSQEESSIDSNLSSDREISPDPMQLNSTDEHHYHRLLLQHHLRGGNNTTTSPQLTLDSGDSFIQHATEKLQRLTQDLNQVDVEELEGGGNKNQPQQRRTCNGDTTTGTTDTSVPSSLFLSNGSSGGAGGAGGVDSLVAAATATLIPTATTDVRALTTMAGGTPPAHDHTDSYRFQPIVPELPTASVPFGQQRSSSPALPTEGQKNHHQPLHQRLSVEDIDENTSRIIKIENYQSTVVGGGPRNDVSDGGGGGGGGGGIRNIIGRPIITGDDLMMESVDLSGVGCDGVDGGSLLVGTGVGDMNLSGSQNRLNSSSPLPNGGRSFSPNLWHGSIETSTDTLVPMDQYGPSASCAFPLSPHHTGNAGVSRPEKLQMMTDEAAVYERRKEGAADQVAEDGGGSISKLVAVGNSDSSSQLELLVAVNGGLGRIERTGDDNKDTAGGGTTVGTTTTAQTGDSNGCDFTSDSQDYDRKLSNQPTSTYTGRAAYDVPDGIATRDTRSTPKELLDNLRSRPLHQQQQQPEVSPSVPESDRGPPASIGQHNNCSVNYNKLKANSLARTTSPPPPITNNMLSSMMLMDESIIIQPQFQQLEINGKQPHSGTGCTDAGERLQKEQQQRRRRNSSLSKHEALMSPIKPTNGSLSPSATHSRFSTPGVRSLPLTPPSTVQFATDRPPVATFSCPDGLAHALSEQNLRLQQIVYEHRLREEALQRELYATRLALMKKSCQHCCGSSVQQPDGNDDPMIDSMNENASNCSWEAVDDRSAPSSGANSSQQMQYSSGVGSSSVLWVPDHAVTRCTTCQTEFWLGLRKHHCRSCGQIFCANCSEYSAHLPDERLYQPVRLCGPCYQRISSTVAPAVNSTTNTNTSSCAPGTVANGSATSLYRATSNNSASNLSRSAGNNHPSVHSMMAEWKHEGNALRGSSEPPRVNESCCKQNVAAAASN
ncbi:myotubularin-related protein 4 [Anopheles coustani]|uniref:myotubularin-related protein 4 n=1 Tax=Anopheles coustani TaxID=139045 RepID=UPI0026584CF9|nr:myotubularin-related protein 4 [Anopheles coustani]